MVSVVVFFVYGFRYVCFMVSVTFFFRFCVYDFRRWIVGGFCRCRVSKMLARLERFFVCFYVFRIGFRRWCLYGFRYMFVWFPLRCLWFPSLDFWWILPPQEKPTF